MEELYSYITDNNFTNKQDYMYSSFGGEDFLACYRRSREKYLGRSQTGVSNEGHNTRYELEWIKSNLIRDSYNIIKDAINSYVKRFEVSKRLYTEYCDDWKVAENASYECLDLYILLAECCLGAYRVTKCTKYFSCLLKIDDTLLSVSSRMTPKESNKFRMILKSELGEFEALKEGEE